MPCFPAPRRRRDRSPVVAALWRSTSTRRMLESAARQRFSVVVPVYRNAESISDGCCDQLEAIAAAGDRATAEVVFVVDGSPDHPRRCSSSGSPLVDPGDAASCCRATSARSPPSAPASRRPRRLLRGDGRRPAGAARAGARVRRRVSATGDVDLVLGSASSRADPLLAAGSRRDLLAALPALVQPDMPAGGVDVFGCNARSRDDRARAGEVEHLARRPTALDRASGATTSPTTACRARGRERLDAPEEAALPVRQHLLLHRPADPPAARDRAVRMRCIVGRSPPSWCASPGSSADRCPRLHRRSMLRSSSSASCVILRPRDRRLLRLAHLREHQAAAAAPVAPDASTQFTAGRCRSSDAPSSCTRSGARASLTPVGEGTRIWAFAHVLPGARDRRRLQHLRRRLHRERRRRRRPRHDQVRRAAVGRAARSTTTCSSGPTPPSPTTGFPRSKRPEPSSSRTDDPRRRVDRRQRHHPARA